VLLQPVEAALDDVAALVGDRVEGGWASAGAAATGPVGLLISPVLALYSIPLISRRSSTRGRPFAPDGGNNNSMTCHCSSVSSCLRTTRPRSKQISQARFKDRL
jgi:hypothetical protein